ncbi:hypothetical protein AMAG_02709 [Allomyces macrogynus ATCC 38327]|uniref:Kinesin motor domain-containing protein n=1 Tax=Allomyces macrogynus (strain ATCC 38327) TaxID=578462 RepID=A0A0L0S2Z7_ALLM3|nr:hypothetical protein, variant [Allomyces macrogynus ATCC 38327]KNE56943.1 hypothetical protein AMAG_02709 [Allomyces macrogynus ATCC 38327]|eukprot:KNE56942.1 hypothetical protein, variant [Allomyces macrogynus ATCC 38327]
MATTSVQVGLRVRPLTAKETLANCSECISYIPSEPQVIIGSDRSFTFDHVFPPDTPQRNVYDQCVAPLIDKFLDGFNATILAYGQTGSGKTYSMGTGLDGNVHTENQGIVPRAIYALFADLPRRYPPPSSYTVKVSFLELYNEELVDLLNPAREPAPGTATGGPSRPGTAASTSSRGGELGVRIREDEFGNIKWLNAREEECTSPEQLLGFLAKGSLCRTTGSTDMNMVSSRSHAIFSVALQLTKVKEEIGETKEITCKFHFVDLAGSERLKKTNAEGARAREGIAINSGLLALGNVISALGDEARLEKGGTVHVPYRDSKLTRLLQDSLGGNSQTLMLACVSPADSNFQETLNTLKYANRARNIKNKVTVNQTVAANSVEVQQLRTQITRLKLELAALREQYGLANPPSQSPSLENLARLQDVGVGGGAAAAGLRERVTDLQNERTKLEVHIQQLQRRIKALELQLINVQAERDMLLMDRDKLAVPTEMVDPDTAMGENGESPPPAPVVVNPIITAYLTKITDLRHQLNDRETEIVMLKQRMAALASKSSALAFEAGGGSVASLPRSGSFSATSAMAASAASFKFVVPGSDGRSERSVDMTLERARQQIREDMNLLSTSMARAATADGGAPVQSPPRPGSVYSETDTDLSELDRPLDLPSALDVPTWAATPSVPGGNGGDTASLASAPELIAAQVMPTESVYKTLHKIQADIAIKEELIQQVEQSQREYKAMRSTYEEKVMQLQANITAVKNERDMALTKLQGTGREKEKDIRARYETKVKQLLGEISTLRRTHLEATKAMNSSKKSEYVLRQMKTSIEALKAEKQRLLKKMREDAERAREHAQASEREIQKLRRKERLATEMAKKYERNFELQKVLLKRRAEEIVASHQKLKDVTALLKRSSVQKTITKNTPLTGSARRLSTMSAVAAASLRSLADEQSEIAMSFRKNQLTKDMEAVVVSQQQSQQMEELLTKRKKLVEEQVELLRERERVVQAEAQRLGTTPDYSAQQYMDDRLELIAAELQYVEARLKALQAEVVQDKSENSYEAICNMVRSLTHDEAVSLLQSLVDDFIQVQILSRNQAIEVRNLETQTEQLRKNLLLMRQTAMSNAVDYEKRIKTMAVSKYLQEQQQPGGGGGGATSVGPGPDGMDRLMDIALFANQQQQQRTGRSRATSPNSATSSRTARQGDDDAMSITSASSSTSPQKHDPYHPRPQRVSSGSAQGTSGPNASAGSAQAAATRRAPRAPASSSGQDVFERLAKTFTVASQAKVRDRDSVQHDSGDLTGVFASANAPPGADLTRRMSHDRGLGGYNGSGSVVNLAPPVETSASGSASRPAGELEIRDVVMGEEDSY